jgi:peptidoglycan/LPS O-acetylase OafA/YrhL
MAAHYAPLSFLRNVMLVDTSINGVMWSLQLEVLAVPLIFAGYFIFRRFSCAPLIMLLFICIGLSFSGRWSKLVSDTASLGLSYSFVLGLLIPSLGRQLVQVLTRRQVAFLMIASLLVLMLTREAVGYGKNWSPVIEAHYSFLLLAGIAYRHDLILFRPLDSRIAHFFGKISYSFYLMHPVALIVAWQIPSTIAAWLQAGVPAVAIALFVGAGVVLFTVPLAYLSYRMFEKPSLRLIRDFDRLQASAFPAQTVVP